MTGRATEAQLDALHGLVAETIMEELRAAKESGKPIPHQLLDKAMKFLALNGVDAPAGSPRVDRLAAELRDLDLDRLAADGRPN